MIVSINQPAFLPWLGYFNRIACSDLHIILDHVQFEKNSFINRNKIRTKEGWAWLTIPVITKGRFGKLEVNRIEIDNHSNWEEKHLSTIRFKYSKSRFFSIYYPLLEIIYKLEFQNLHMFIRSVNEFIFNALDIKTPIVFSSGLKTIGKKDELILNLCKEVGATTYLSGPFGKDYLIENKFNDAGIKVIYQDYKHPIYSQIYDGFQPNMSIIDLLFNHGPKSLEILMSGNKL